MYFKISLLFCALYFITAVWSIGLSLPQINSCVQLSKKYITNVIDDKTMPELLIKLAMVEKESDEWTEKGFTTYEVRLFVRMFTIQDKKGVHDGLLTYAELENLIDDGLSLKSDVKDKIKKKFNNDDLINAQQFLAAILEYKPEGKGLDKTQIQRCGILYKYDYGYLHTERLKDLLQALHIVSNDYNTLLEFEHFQTAANELKELLVIWSEYNKDVEENSPCFTSKEVREYISEFSLYDRNMNGVLKFEEFKPIANLYFSPYKPISILKLYSDFYFTPESREFEPANKPHDKEADRKDKLNIKCSMSAAMYLNMKYYLRFGRKKRNNFEEVATNENVAIQETYDRAWQNIATEETNENVSMEDTNVRRNHGNGLRLFRCFGSR
ncbi:uncharacterized protein LOC126836537 isoform X2 [Adelges cooleyi]|uniref:uncharacterized protein LOC126836537 isoform X2 n=1 Tax=Adelges cooleyi TaxID=133065 RepID=UPI00217F5F45|nr:uncharacterized protein LOC126836537 isoform X2 [Adelges cooleyi]